MKSLLRRLREKFFSHARPQNVRRRPRYVRLGIEDLEERLVLDAYTFIGAVNNGDGTSWNDPLNWVDANRNGAPGVPGAGDTASIGSSFSVVIPAQYSAGIINLTLRGVP